jgi:hypothetical protein
MSDRDRDVRLRVEVRVVPGTPADVPRLWYTHDLRDVRLAEADGKEVDFENVTVERVDFSRLKINAFTSSGSRFVDCDFSRTRFELAGGFSYDPPSTFVGCRFERSDLRAMFLLNSTRFERCAFVNARIVGWKSYCAEFVDCTFEGKIVRSRFCGRPSGPYSCARTAGRERNEFRGNDFSRAELIDTEFTYGIDIDAQRWPDHPVYVRFERWMERVHRARAVIARWPDDRERERALEILDILHGLGMEEQAVAFMRRDTLRGHPEIRDRVFALLEAPFA